MSYVKNSWKSGDIITATKLNHMEDGIAAGGSGSESSQVVIDFVVNREQDAETGDVVYLIDSVSKTPLEVSSLIASGATSVIGNLKIIIEPGKYIIFNSCAEIMFDGQTSIPMLFWTAQSMGANFSAIPDFSTLATWTFEADQQPLPSNDANLSAS